MKNALIVILIVFACTSQAFARGHSLRYRELNFATGKWHYVRLTVPAPPKPWVPIPLIVTPLRGANGVHHVRLRKYLRTWTHTDATIKIK